MKVFVTISALAFAAVCFAGAVLKAPPLAAEEFSSIPLAQEVFELFPSEEIADLSGRSNSSYSFDESAIDEDEEMRSLGFFEKEEVISLATASPKRLVDAPLKQEEVGRLFYLIVALFEAPVPIEGKLEKITFLKQEGRLIVCAEVEVFLSQVLKAAHIDFLPQSAHFFVCVPLTIENSKISADCEKIVLRCESFVLPEGLLCYGCEAAFGVRDYKKFFGEAVGNVLRNAYFYG